MEASVTATKVRAESLKATRATALVTKNLLFDSLLKKNPAVT
jgi:hypothetical protein